MIELLVTCYVWACCGLCRDLRTLDEVVASYCSPDCLPAADSMAEDRADVTNSIASLLNGLQSAVQWSGVYLGHLSPDPLHRVLFFKEREPEIFRNSVTTPPGLGEVLFHLSSARREYLPSKSRLRLGRQTSVWPPHCKRKEG